MAPALLLTRPPAPGMVLPLFHPGPRLWPTLSRREGGGQDDSACPSTASTAVMRIQKLLEPLERPLLGAFAIKFCCWCQFSRLPVVSLRFDRVVPALGSFVNALLPYPGSLRWEVRSLGWLSFEHRGRWCGRGRTSAVPAATENCVWLSAVRACEGTVATFSPSASGLLNSLGLNNCCLV